VHFAEPLPTTDGGVLRTIGDAVAYMTALPKHRELRNAWQHACRLILAREPVEAITRQRGLALFADAGSPMYRGPPAQGENVTTANTGKLVSMARLRYFAAEMSARELICSYI
jgi:hypothetical protein